MKFKVKVMDKYKYYWGLVCEAENQQDIIESLSPHFLRIGAISKSDITKARVGRLVGNIRIVDCHYTGDVIRGYFA